jgi:NitT/TauT family transport system permease protein
LPEAPDWAARALPPVATAIGLIVAWQAGVTLFGVPAYIAPAPTAVIMQFVSQGRLILDSFLPTAAEAIAGFALGNTVAFALAVLLVRNVTVERCVYPLVVFLHSIPILAIAPILVLVLGTGYAPKIAISALICFFPTLVNMVRGLKSAPRDMLELMRVLSASEREILAKVLIPCSLPFLFAALKVTAPASVIGAIVGEWIGSSYGLGAMILEATYNFRAALLYAAVFLCAGLAIAMFSVAALVERRMTRWAGRS